MARLIEGTTNVASAGTAARIDAAPERVLWLHIHARTGNTNNIYVGASTVSSTRGKPIAANATFEINPGIYDHTIILSNIFVDADTNGNDADWVALVV